MNDQVTTVASLLAESLNQLSFICALLGGFSVSLIAGLLTAEKNNISKWAAIVMGSVAVSQIGFTLFLSLSAFRIYTYTANQHYDKLQNLLTAFDSKLLPFIVIFFISIILFFMGISITGFLFGKKVGIAVSTISVLIFGIVFYSISILTR
jgi:hypothetical protein